ncbi:small RNA 2'-O-methyltransferase isoform X1 [Drosophila subpulchrella]|uniref:small RNA 2'-O-methyltransferase isoform X1 n=1 Tax=Drosophila subpulchrella TaxID=1486046 RepID=UPI0018A1AD87|nr:small RNA 2'-O-methyltransferase isoform X1 [Drosophila subpulchrella]
MFCYKFPCGDFQTLTKMTETGITFDPPVYEQRYCAAIQILEDSRWSNQIKKVVEFGCAEMRFFQLMRRIEKIENILLVDIDEPLLRKNSTSVDPLVSDYIRRREGPLSVQILQGSVADSSEELRDTDAVIALELIEHVYDDVLSKIPSNIFGFMQPKLVVFSTPNSDYNVIFTRFNPLLPNGFRHDDHKFEWTREEFKSWCLGIVEKYPNYMFSLMGVGNPPKDLESVGHVSQIAIFVRKDFLDMQLENPLVATPELDDESTPYKLIHSVDYPFYVDTRTEKEKLWTEVQIELQRFKRIANLSENELDSYQDTFKVPIAHLLDRLHHVGATKEVLLELLQENNLKIDEECVIIEDSDKESEDSEPYELSERLSQDVVLTDQEQEECWDLNPES